MLALLAIDFSAAAPAPGAEVIDAADCARLPRAPTLIASDYLVVPPRHEARSSPAEDARRLFGYGEAHESAFVKKSIAAGYPVLLYMNAPGGSASGDTWKPIAGGGDGAAGRCRALLAVAYDDARYGGAFEVMPACQTAGGQQLLWLRYEDCPRFCDCAVEVLGSRSTAAAPDLAGQLTFEHDSGSDMPITPHAGIHRLQFPYPSGTRFRVHLSTQGPAYVYLFTSDLSYRVHPVFPANDDSAYLAYQENHVAIPDEERYLQLDDRPGTDYFIALYATQRADTRKFIRLMEAEQGDLATRLHKVLADDAIPADKVRFTSSDGIRFAAKSNGGWLVAVVVEIEHVR